MWGILSILPRHLDERGITPTYVGNTISILMALLVRLDHPHIRGEYYKYFSQTIYKIRSPPHTWGIPSKTMLDTFGYRITPTYVGNTHLSIDLHWFTWDHPHIRGEYNLVKSSMEDVEGSPPHTWGIPS